MNLLSIELSKRLARPVEVDLQVEGTPSIWEPSRGRLRVYLRLANGWLPICALIPHDMYDFPYDEVADCLCFHLRMRKLPRNALKIN